MSRSEPARVIKLGGSLLDQPDLRSRLSDWLARQPPAANVMLVGGGRWVEMLREADRRHGLGEEACHWLAVRAMGLTARLVQAILPESRLVTRLADVDLQEDRPTLFDPWEFLQDEERSAVAPLPHRWDVTSDSIAARLAVRLGAGELVLLKSALPETGCQDYVDRYFSQAATGLHVRCVNLRDRGELDFTL